jgi:aminoglycoside phosphotransferase (APT) family kinase protein
MLRPDPALPARDLSWTTAAMAELFAQRILPALWPGAQPLELKRRYTAYKPGKECLVLYSLRLGDPGRESPRLATVTFGRPERLRTLHARHYAAPGARSRAVLLAEPACLVELFPADWKLPLLASATDRRAVGRELAAGEARAASAAPTVRDLQVLRYRPRRRCVLVYTIEGLGSEAPRQVIGKVYPDAPTVAGVAAKLRTLGPQARAEGLELPTLLGGASLLLMEKVPGANLGDLLEATSAEEDARGAIRLVAGSLASFHRLHLGGGEARSTKGELELLRERIVRMRSVAPLVGERAESLLDEIGRRLPGVACGEPTLIHGDFKPSQLLVHEGRVGLVDLDRASPGEPVIDLGNFLAVLTKHAVVKEQPHLRRLGPEFLDEYAVRSGRRGLAAGSRLFESLALVRMLVRKLERTPRSYALQGSAWKALELLDHADERLQEPAGSHGDG